MGFLPKISAQKVAEVCWQCYNDGVDAYIETKLTEVDLEPLKIGPLTREILQKQKCFIAGGWFRSPETGRDKDIYFYNVQDLQEVREYLEDLGFESSEIDSGPSNPKNSVAMLSAWDLHFTYDQDDLAGFDLIKITSGQPEEVLRGFDFTVAKKALYYKDDGFYTLEHKSWAEDLASKVIRYENIEKTTQPLSEHPLSHLSRIMKYHNYGFTVAKSDHLRVLEAVCQAEGCSKPLSEFPYVAPLVRDIDRQSHAGLWHSNSSSYSSNIEAMRKVHHDLHLDTDSTNRFDLGVYELSQLFPGIPHFVLNPDPKGFCNPEIVQPATLLSDLTVEDLWTYSVLEDNIDLFTKKGLSALAVLCWTCTLHRSSYTDDTRELLHRIFRAADDSGQLHLLDKFFIELMELPYSLLSLSEWSDFLSGPDFNLTQFLISSIFSLPEAEARGSLNNVLCDLRLRERALREKCDCMDTGDWLSQTRARRSRVL